MDEKPSTGASSRMEQAFDQSMEREGMKPSTGASSGTEPGSGFASSMLSEGLKPSPALATEIERRRVAAYLEGISASLRALRGEPRFWLKLGPAFRVRYEDFQGDLAMLIVAYRE